MNTNGKRNYSKLNALSSGIAGLADFFGTLNDHRIRKIINAPVEKKLQRAWITVGDNLALAMKSYEKSLTAKTSKKRP